MDVQQIAHGETQKILDMLGPENIFAILGAILITRTIRGLWYLDKRASFVVAITTAYIVGSLTTYFSIDTAALKQVLGAGFLTAIGSIIAFTAAQWALRFLIEMRHGKPGEKTLLALYFFLSPAPVKIKQKFDGGEVTEEVQHEELTRIGNTWRLDQDRRARHVPVELTVEDMTQFIPPSQRAGENFDPDKTPTPISEKWKD